MMKKILKLQKKNIINDIKIIDKPDYISWDEITELLHNSYQEREESGLHFAASKSTSEINAKKLEYGRCFVALDGDKIVGMIYLLTPPWPFSINKNGKKKWYCDNNGGVLNNLAVRSDYKGKGIGKKLLNHSIKAAKDMQLISLILDTSCELKGLNKFYDNMGFKKVDFISWETTNYYSIVRKLFLSKRIPRFYRIIRYYLSLINTILLVDKNGKYRNKNGI
jgi:ribosomal protein S18 acetylase RimI-like enzyme